MGEITPLPLPPFPNTLSLSRLSLHYIIVQSRSLPPHSPKSSTKQRIRSCITPLPPKADLPRPWSHTCTFHHPHFADWLPSPKGIRTSDERKKDRVTTHDHPIGHNALTVQYRYSTRTCMQGGMPAILVCTC